MANVKAMTANKTCSVRKLAYTAAFKSRAVAKVRSGWSYSATGRVMGCSLGSVKRWCDIEGVASPYADSISKRDCKSKRQICDLFYREGKTVEECSKACNCSVAVAATCIAEAGYAIYQELMALRAKQDQSECIQAQLQELNAALDRYNEQGLSKYTFDFVSPAEEQNDKARLAAVVQDGIRAVVDMTRNFILS